MKVSHELNESQFGRAGYCNFLLTVVRPKDAFCSTQAILFGQLA
jgi:hypothetical protein